MKTPSAILRSLSLRRIHSRRSPVAAVVPLPARSQFDQQLSTELDNLRLKGANEPRFPSVNWLVHALDASINTQKLVLDSFVHLKCNSDVDRKAIDGYLENDFQLLDMCNYFVDKIDIFRKYVGSLRAVLHLVDDNVEPNSRALRGALHILESCQCAEKMFEEMGKRSLCLRRMFTQKPVHETQLSNIVCGSKATALMVCRFLEFSLSFKFNSKQRLPKTKQPQLIFSMWLSSLHELRKEVEERKQQNRRKRCTSALAELQQTAIAAQNLQEQIKGRRIKEVASASKELETKCGELEAGLELIEGRLKELYKHLIDVRMTLLGILSQT